MNTAEGIRRIRLLGKRIMQFGTLAAVALWIVMLAFHYSAGLAELFFLAWWPLCIGGGMWGIAWIVEGFLRP